MSRLFSILHRITHRAFALMLCLLFLPAYSLADPFRPSGAYEGKVQALDLLEDVAFRSEYGAASGGQNLIRWEDTLRIRVTGTPTATDLAFLEDFLMTLSFRVPQLPPIVRTDGEDANIVIAYVPLSEMAEHVEGYIEDNWGFVSYWCDAQGCIVREEIAIASDVTSLHARQHLILEEIVNGLGLCNHHSIYNDSILYEAWTETQLLSEVDWLMLNMIYSPEVAPGMTYPEVRNAIRSAIAP
ncbi:MAG: DUF2927 domain-containing protein [Clostridia bacterium]|nr:DUF2927 domain-containing protein [Clostridia bacterium]